MTFHRLRNQAHFTHTLVEMLLIDCSSEGPPPKSIGGDDLSPWKTQEKGGLESDPSLLETHTNEFHDISVQDEWKRI